MLEPVRSNSWRGEPADGPFAEDGARRWGVGPVPQPTVHLAPQVHDPWDQGHVRPGEDRQANHVGILLDHRFGDLLRSLVEPRVDHLHAGVTQSAGDDLRPSVVTVEAGLGHDDADLP